MTEVTAGWVSWQPLMELAIKHKHELAMGVVNRFGPLLELGAGDGSTAWIADHWPGNILTLDSDAVFVERFAHLRSRRHRIEHAPTWDVPEIDRPWGGRWSIALVDHAPGERRVTEIKRLAEICDIIIIHDSEPAQRHGYGYDSIWPLFKHLRHDERLNTWATALSNSVNVGDWRLE